MQEKWPRCEAGAAVRRNVMLARFDPEGAPRDLGIAFTDDLRERSVAVYHSSPSEGGRGREAGASTAYVDDACSLDPETGFLSPGPDLNAMGSNRLMLAR